ncbi:MAG: hypothetical protein ABEH88_01510 [Halobacteriales archaeon]
MHVTPETVDAERDRIEARADVVVPLINDVRSTLGEAFETPVDSVTMGQYHTAVDAVFAEGDVAVNVAAFSALLRDLDVTDDYPGFVVDEYLGRRLAATIAGREPLALLAEATFHYADVMANGGDDEPAGADDRDAALAAGFQTRLPGWQWREGTSPFGVT